MKSGLFVVMLAISIHAHAQGITFNEVPVADLKGRVLSLDRFNLSIEAPDDGWHWLITAGTEQRRPKQVVYVCEETTTGRRFAVTVIDQALSEVEPKGMGSDVAARATRSGWEIESASSEASAIPRPRSIRVVWRGHKAKGPSLTTYLYIVTARIGYTLLYQGPETTEPDDFQRFARSFRLLRDVPPLPKGETIRSVTYYFLLAVGLLLGLLANLIARRRLIDPGLVGGILVIGYLAFRLVAATRAGIMAGVSSDSVRELMIESAFEPFWPVAIAVAVSILARRKKPAGPGTSR